ncbi:hemerythrin domain-containing protein [Methylocystis sp. FS]|nr:hemerythrin domain-containing protein [Methylocystis silviterrae]
MIAFRNTRRHLLVATGAVLMLSGANSKSAPAAAKRDKRREEMNEKEVGAVEDLMREHGVIRRAILVYRNMAAKLRANPASLDPELLRRTATMFRAFGEDYHERQLEETHIFPLVKKTHGQAVGYVDILVAQHQRGREITDYVLTLTSKGAIGTGDAELLARALDGVEMMYAHHAAREDTVIFPAWKNVLSAHQLEEMGELFEEIEHKQFGKDGFDDAVAQIARIEEALGIADIAQFTPSPPPKG